MRIRAALIVLFGVPVCVAIVTAFPLLWVMGQVKGPPLPRADLIQGSIFVIFALVAAVVAFSAFMRTRQGGTGDFAWLAKLFPVLAVLGAGFGAWFGWTTANNRFEADDSSRAELCRFPEIWGMDAPSCLSTSRRCREDAWNDPPRPGSDPHFLPLRDVLSNAQLRLMDEEMAAQKAGRFPDTQMRHQYDQLLEDLSSTFVIAGRNRQTMVCLLNAKK